jgi:hypothetical protein
MDPDSTVRAILEAIASHHFEEAADLADELLTWLRQGGFPPAGHDHGTAAAFACAIMVGIENRGIARHGLPVPDPKELAQLIYALSQDFKHSPLYLDVAGEVAHGLATGLAEPEHRHRYAPSVN